MSTCVISRWRYHSHTTDKYNLNLLSTYFTGGSGITHTPLTALTWIYCFPISQMISSTHHWQSLACSQCLLITHTSLANKAWFYCVLISQVISFTRHWQIQPESTAFFFHWWYHSLNTDNHSMNPLPSYFTGYIIHTLLANRTFTLCLVGWTAWRAERFRPWIWNIWAAFGHRQSDVRQPPNSQVKCVG